MRRHVPLQMLKSKHDACPCRGSVRGTAGHNNTAHQALIIIRIAWAGACLAVQARSVIGAPLQLRLYPVCRRLIPKLCILVYYFLFCR